MNNLNEVIKNAVVFAQLAGEVQSALIREFEYAVECRNLVKPYFVCGDQVANLMVDMTYERLIDDVSMTSEVEALYNRFHEERDGESFAFSEREIELIMDAI
jgi:hypothetical protein